MAYACLLYNSTFFVKYCVKMHKIKWEIFQVHSACLHSLNSKNLECFSSPTCEKKLKNSTIFTDCTQYSVSNPTEITWKKQCNHSYWHVVTTYNEVNHKTKMLRELAEIAPRQNESSLSSLHFWASCVSVASFALYCVIKTFSMKLT